MPLKTSFSTKNVALISSRWLLPQLSLIHLEETTIDYEQFIFRRLHLHLYVPALGKVPFALWLFLLGWPHTPQAFLETSLPRSPLLLERTHSQRTAATPGTSSPTLLEYCVGSLTSHRELMNVEDICETGPTVYSPYPRRLESLTICRCNYKGSTFSSAILRP